MDKQVKVLVVDDSALVRKLLTELIEDDPEITVVGTAPDAYIAREKIKKLNPDVLTLDVEMPKMDGITFLSNLMRLHPLPVVMVSSLTQAGAEVTLRALEIGAIDFVCKPVEDLAQQLKSYGEIIREKIKAAASARVKAYESEPARKIIVEKKYSADAIISKIPHMHSRTTDTLIAIGASTGGTEAIKDVLTQLPPDTPGIVITQHIPGNFSTAFANRMNNLSTLNVCEAQDGQQILTGHAYIAPGDQHLLVARSGSKYYCRLNDGPPVNRHKPSVDVLFRSVTQCAGLNSVGILLTGMGDDGAKGLKEMQEANAPTIAQDEKTSVVWGMPGSAVKLGAADYILPLQQVAGKMIALTQREKKFGT